MIHSLARTGPLYAHGLSALLLPSLVGTAVATPGDELLVSAFTSASVTRHDAGDGALLGALGPAPLAGVLGAVVGPDARIYVCSESNDRVLRFDPSGALFDEFIVDDPMTAGDETGGLDGPSGIVFGPNGNAFVASFNTDAVLEYDGATGAFVRVFVQPGDGNLNGPDAGLAFGPDDDLFVPSFFNDRIKRYDGTSGAFEMNFVSPLTTGLVNPRTIHFPGDGFGYVASEGGDEVLQVDEGTGALVQRLVTDDPGTMQDETGGLDGPTGLRFGPDGRLYVGSINTDSVQRYEADGTFVDEFVAAGSGGIDAPTFLIFRPDVDLGCDPAPNSASSGARISIDGFTSVAAGGFELVAHFVPAQVSALFFYGNPVGPLPFGDGFRCVGGTVQRLGVQSTDAAGILRRAVDPIAEGISAGSQVAFQLYFRDTAAGGAGFNTSSSILATFTP